MDRASKELAVATVSTGRGFNKSWIIWILLVLIVIGFSGIGPGFGIFGIRGFGTPGYGAPGYGYGTPNPYNRRRPRRGQDEVPVTSNVFEGRNFFFILIVFALLFLVAENSGTNTNVINVDTEDAGVY